MNGFVVIICDVCPTSGHFHLILLRRVFRLFPCPFMESEIRFDDRAILTQVFNRSFSTLSSNVKFRGRKAHRTPTFTRHVAAVPKRENFPTLKDTL